MKVDTNDILLQFDIKANIKKYGNGHINDTFLVQTGDVILQRINTNVFKNPKQLMDNINNVTTFLKAKISKNSGDTERETLTVIKTKDGKNYYKYDENNYYRAYKFITNTKTIEVCSSPKDMYYAGKGFGSFQKMLDDYPVDNLHETIMDFHNTPKRVEALKEAINEDKCCRANNCKADIEFALKFADKADIVVNALQNGSVPLRVTHNDTKINNILFDADSGEPLCVIDLDTVMPGSSLYDFGDALRIGASTAAEDETDLTKVTFNIESFENFAKGYFEQMKDKLTLKEVELLAFSAALLTYECGIRFLTDYLCGDTYFKIHRENHNLDRARNQFKLVSDINENIDKLNSIINNLYKREQ